MVEKQARVARVEGAAGRGVIDVLSAFILIGSALAAVAAIVQPINQVTQGGGFAHVTLTGEAQQQAMSAVSGVPGESWLQFPPNGGAAVWHVFSVSWPLRLLSEAGTSVLLGCLAVAGLLLARTLGTIRAGAPFDPANPRRLRFIGLLLVVGGLAQQGLDAWARLALLDAVDAGSSTPFAASTTLDVTWVASGLLTLVFAEAFAAGRRLTDDVAGLI